MSRARLERVGRVQALESYLEGQLPVLIAGGWWGWLIVLLTQPRASRAFSGLELALLLGAGVALASWALSRVMFLLGARRPVLFTIAGLVLAVFLVQALHLATTRRYASQCGDHYGGELVPTEGERSVCVVDRTPDSPYLAGTILRPSWHGTADLDWPILLVMGLATVAGSLAFRDRRLRRSRVAKAMIDEFRFARAAGISSVRGEPGDDKAILACDNRTLWGETCGQLYWEDAIEADDPCVRCGFGFHAGETVSLKAVGLATDRVDKLNVLERRFASHEPWAQGEAGRSAGDIRMSAAGPARWGEIWEFRLPRTLTIAQTLALIADQLEPAGVAGLAKRRASRISAWIWHLPGEGQWLPNLAVQPGARYSLVAATERLGDVLERYPGRPVLQLDVGLVPVQFRFGNRRATAQNLNQNLVIWLPVRSPHEQGDAAWSWVPRVETAALRTWLSVVRRSGEGEERLGIDVMPYVWPEDADPGHWRDGAGRAWRLRSPTEDEDPSRLTLVRMSWAEGGEPVVHPTLGLLGACLDEWEWLDRDQIEQLREGVVVALPRDHRKRLVERVREAEGGAA